MTPTEVPASLAAGRGRRKSRIPFEPVVNDVIVKLFTPQHPGKGLTLDRFEFARHPRGSDPVVELVRGLDFTGEYTIKIVSQCGFEVQLSSKPQLEDLGFRGVQCKLVMGGCFRACLRRIDDPVPARDVI